MNSRDFNPILIHNYNQHKNPPTMHIATTGGWSLLINLFNYLVYFIIFDIFL